MDINIIYDRGGFLIPTLAVMKKIHMGAMFYTGKFNLCGATTSVQWLIYSCTEGTEYFFFSKDVKNFIFEDLNLNGTAGVVGACLVCFAFTVLLEGTKSLLYYLSLRMSQNPLTYGHTDTSINQDRSTLFSALMIPASMAQIRRQRVRYHVGGYLLHTIDLFLGYILMLAVMSYDAYIFISVVLGSGVGYFIFGAVNAYNRTKFNALKLSVYDRYDSQAGLTVSPSVTNSEITLSSPR